VNERIKIDGSRMAVGLWRILQEAEQVAEFQRMSALEELVILWEKCDTLDEMGQEFHAFMSKVFGIERWQKAREGGGK
jgi:hypothetical protein